MPSSLLQVRLSDNEHRHVEQLALEVLKDQPTVFLDGVVDEINLLAAEVPRRLRRTFADIHPNETISAIHLIGAPYRSTDVATPRPVYDSQKQNISFNDVVHLLFTFLLGQPFTFDTIQSGRIISDVSPDPSAPNAARSSGYASTFDFHTDDAFSDLAGDFLCLRCIRNQEGIPTFVSFCDDLDLGAEWASPLFEPHFLIAPNIAHNVDRATVPTRSVLFGSRTKPYIRINLNIPAAMHANNEAKTAYAKLERGIREVAHTVCLRAGECLYVDNFRSVHARPSYSPTPDGKSRWYRRVYATSCFRNSRAKRASPTARVIGG